MEPAFLPRREREKARQRQEMLEAALRLFSERGYHNVTMHEIARAAEFAIGTLYKFFRSKEDLYRTLMTDLADRFHRALRAALDEPGDEVEKLRRFVRVKGEVFRANVQAIRLFFAEVQGASFNLRAGLNAELRERQDQGIQALESVFAAAFRRRRFRRIAAPHALAVALESITNAFLFLWLEAPDRYPYPEDPDTILNLFFKGLLEP